MGGRGDWEVGGIGWGGLGGGGFGVGDSEWGGLPINKYYSPEEHGYLLSLKTQLVLE